ncbi:hypothetical protein GCM10009603_46650 [Nocardiopsis exhalans]
MKPRTPRTWCAAGAAVRSPRERTDAIRARRSAGEVPDARAGDRTDRIVAPGTEYPQEALREGKIGAETYLDLSFSGDLGLAKAARSHRAQSAAGVPWW